MAERASPIGTLQLVEGVEARICSLRGMRVMLSHDLAELYAVEARALVQAVKRNPQRFPKDFCFQLTKQELADLRSQTVISSWGGSRSTPYAFTEQGVAMLSSVLRSNRAIAVNIEIMRTFVKLRSLLESNKELAEKLTALEAKYDDQFTIVFEAIRELMAPSPGARKRRIGFVQD